MKKMLALLAALAMAAVVLAGCGGENVPEETGKADSLKPDTTVTTEPVSLKPDIPGEIYDTGEFRALVPEGWAAFPVKDVFAEEDALDPSCFNIIKEAPAIWICSPSLMSAWITMARIP